MGMMHIEWVESNFKRLWTLKHNNMHAYMYCTLFIPFPIFTREEKNSPKVSFGFSGGLDKSLGASADGLDESLRPSTDGLDESRVPSSRANCVV